MKLQSLKPLKIRGAFVESSTKLASGRYCLALMAGAVFIVCSIRGQLEGKDVVVILAIVFQSYFNRSRNFNNQSPGSLEAERLPEKSSD